TLDLVVLLPLALGVLVALTGLVSELRPPRQAVNDTFRLLSGKTLIDNFGLSRPVIFAIAVIRTVNVFAAGLFIGHLLGPSLQGDFLKGIFDTVFIGFPVLFWAFY